MAALDGAGDDFEGWLGATLNDLELETDVYLECVTHAP